jgi:hypothetical protein
MGLDPCYSRCNLLVDYRTYIAHSTPREALLRPKVGCSALTWKANLRVGKVGALPRRGKPIRAAAPRPLRGGDRGPAPRPRPAAPMHCLLVRQPQLPPTPDIATAHGTYCGAHFRCVACDGCMTHLPAPANTLPAAGTDRWAADCTHRIVHLDSHPSDVCYNLHPHSLHLLHLRTPLL